MSLFRKKRIFILPVLAVLLGILILYPFFSRNFADIYFAIKTAFSTHKLIILPGFNLKYLILFSGLILMSITDMLFERISAVIPVFLILAGLLFVYMANKPLINAFEALGIGLGIFILIIKNINSWHRKIIGCRSICSINSTRAN